MGTLASVAQAQSLPPISPPRLEIATPVESPVTLQSVAIQTEINGSLALTIVELAFFNPSRRELEGELQFPLLDGQSVVGFALEVDGQLREAVPVEKARGQAVFEDVTRARIDPGVLQVTQGNNFKLRVYPLLPGQPKRVIVRYAEKLPAKNGRHLYRLPLVYGNELPAFALRLSVNGTAAKPLVVQNAALPMAFTRDGKRYTAEVSRRNFTGGVLEVTVPVATKPQIYTQPVDGKSYFWTEVPVPTRRAKRRFPRVVGLVWDSSGSGVGRDHGREFALLEAYFRALGRVEVRLVRLRNDAEPAQHFEIVNADWQALHQALEATPYDGGTNLGALTRDPAVQEYLVFSDGLSNVGDRPFPAMSVPVYTISASPRADPSLLRQIAEAHGGRFIDLLTDATREAADKLLFSTSRLLAMEGRGATQLVVASPYPVSGKLTIAGVLTEPSASLRLSVGLSGQRRRTVTVPVRARQNVSTVAASAWAQLRIAELDGEYETHRAEIQRLGQAFGIVTRYTALIVLDHVEDYARFQITPPPELLAEYQRLLATLAQQQQDEKDQHLEKVVKLLQVKEAWWRYDFPKDAPPPSSPLPPPPPPPPPPPAARSGEKVGSNVQGPISIQLQSWTPDAPYRAHLHQASAVDLYRVYLEERPGYLRSTAFFLDAADEFFDQGLPELGVRVLTNLAEMDLQNRHVLRILGYRLMQAKQPQLAIPVFKTVLDLSPDEPQSYRDLGLAYAADRQFQKAVDTLYEAVIRPWHERFPEVELITLADLTAIVATADAPVDTSRIDSRLLKNLSLDLRVVLTWDADNTDIDLWVTDPNGEKAFYGNRLTYQGGRMSRDFTGGYGPEEFSLRHAKPGTYKVQADFYGHRQQIVAGATTVQVALMTGFGTAAQREQIITMRLKGPKEVIFVGEFEVGQAYAH
jgi:tetratricopeptide (TPR) repeat protein